MHPVYRNIRNRSFDRQNPILNQTFSKFAPGTAMSPALPALRDQKNCSTTATTHEI
jgi:hypothetical protein